jgi:hypothetical protein
MRFDQFAAIVVSACSFVGLLPGAAQSQEPAQMLQALLGPRFSVFRGKVQEELQLTGEQRFKLNGRIDETIREANEFFQGLQDAKPEDRQKKHADYAQKAEQKLETLLKESLNEDQLKRMRQIVLQMEGLFAIGHPEVFKELNITDEQRKKFMEVVQNLQKTVEPLMKEMQQGGDPQVFRSKMLTARLDHQDQIRAFLTDAQKQKWKDMTGKTFELDD